MAGTSEGLSKWCHSTWPKGRSHDAGGWSDMAKRGKRNKAEDLWFISKWHEWKDDWDDGEATSWNTSQQVQIWGKGGQFPIWGTMNRTCQCHRDREDWEQDKRRLRDALLLKGALCRKDKCNFKRPKFQRIKETSSESKIVTKNNYEYIPLAKMNTRWKATSHKGHHLGQRGISTTQDTGSFVLWLVAERSDPLFPYLLTAGGSFRWRPQVEALLALRVGCPKSRIPGIREFTTFQVLSRHRGSWDAIVLAVGLPRRRQDEDKFNLGLSWENCVSNPTCWLTMPSPPGLTQFSSKPASLCCSHGPWHLGTHQGKPVVILFAELKRFPSQYTDLIKTVLVP